MRKKPKILKFLLIVAVFSVASFLVNAIYASKNSPAIHQVSLYEKGADPDALFVGVGESVQFNSRDGKSHIIAQGGGSEFDQEHDHSEFGPQSGLFGPDEAYRVQFKKKGTYHLHDHLNPKIFVTIVAYEPG